MDDLERLELEHQLLRAQGARKELEFKIARNLKENVKLQEHIKLQDEVIAKVEQKLGG